MTYKKNIYRILAFSSVAFLLSLVFMYSVNFGLCRSTYTTTLLDGKTPTLGCLDDTSTSQAIGIFSLLIFIFTLLLCYFEEYFKSWKNFALWWVPLSLLFIFATPSSGGGSLGIGGMIDREWVTNLFGGLFLFLSISIVFWKWLNDPKSQKEQEKMRWKK